jgi:hypothetical protein
MNVLTFIVTSIEIFRGDGSGHRNGKKEKIRRRADCSFHLVVEIIGLLRVP